RDVLGKFRRHCRAFRRFVEPHRYSDVWVRCLWQRSPGCPDLREGAPAPGSNPGAATDLTAAVAAGSFPPCARAPRPASPPAAALPPVGRPGVAALPAAAPPTGPMAASDVPAVLLPAASPAVADASRAHRPGAAAHPEGRRLGAGFPASALDPAGARPDARVVALRPAPTVSSRA